MKLDYIRACLSLVVRSKVEDRFSCIFCDSWEMSLCSVVNCVMLFILRGGAMNMMLAFHFNIFLFIIVCWFCGDKNFFI